MWNNQSISWIFFDIGETLVDESKPIGDSIEQFVQQAGKLGYSIEAPTVKQALMDYHRQLCEFPMRHVMKQLVPSEQDRLAIWKAMAFRKELEEPYPESLKVLSTLQPHYKIGIIANQSKGTVSRLEKYGMLPYISLVCCSAETGLSKPDARFYELALKEAGCLPGQAVMIGDRIDNDVIPAKSLGMSAIWVRQGLAKHQDIPQNHTAPDAVVECLNDILAYFA
ncbi:HAD family hydrolase [Paenibacillus agricola]|uniref:HAD family hydrolase n=1 Tax=Paenibacillus agricola TaxID=2716264 RepID=A0ABX0J0F1_9BACL|nr:HAD family hydrolase [Paenibacillus agricola]NHN28906.1 HAD family hydrolase [Paenibacillus agricola]